MSIAGWNRAQALMDADIRDFVFWSRVDTGSKNGVIHVNSSPEIVINNALEENAVNLTIEIEPKQTGIGTPSAPVLYESSNGTLTFTATKNQNATSAVFGMEPKQSGSGDASPTNVRSLAAYDELQYSDGTTTTIDVNALAGEDIYGGTYDAVSGVLTKTHDVADLSLSNWEYVKTYTNANTFNVEISGLAENGDGLCDRYKYEKVSLVALQPDKTFFFYKDNNSVMRISVRDDDYSNAVDFKASLSNGMNVCYPLATPVTYNGTPATKNIVSGTNTFSNLTGSYVAVTDAGNIRPIVNHTSTKLYHNVYRYGVRWNRVDAACTERLWDAADITMNTTNFCYKSKVNANYSNPFDEVYPFNQFRLCSVNILDYRALQAGDDIRDAVTKWDGAVNSAASGGFTGAYRPEYWYTAYEDTDGSIVIGVSSGEIDGWIHREPYIRGYGFATDGGYGDNSEQLLNCDTEVPLVNKSYEDLHTYANNSGFTIEDVYTYSAELTAMVVEYANMDMQTAIGLGCDKMYSESQTNTVYSNTTSGTTNTVTLGVNNNGYYDYISPGVILDFGSGTGSGYNYTFRRWAKSITQVTISNKKYTQLTLNSRLSSSSLSGYRYAIHGCVNRSGFVSSVNITPQSVGYTALVNKSGYLGSSGRCNVFYRGAVAFANMTRYVLGAYRRDSDDSLWICDEQHCDDYDALDVSVHTNTGLHLYNNAGFISSLHIVPGIGLFPFVKTTSNSATSSAPIGDYANYNDAENDTIFSVGGGCGSTTITTGSSNKRAGPFCVTTSLLSTVKTYVHAVIPILKTK